MEELYTAATAMLDAASVPYPPGKEGRDAVTTGLLQVIGDEGVSLHTWEPPMAVRDEERPMVRASSRLTARRFGFVTGARHDRVTLDPAVVHLTCLLDGTRDRRALLQEMRELA